MTELIDAFCNFVNAPKKGEMIDCYAEREGTFFAWLLNSSSMLWLVALYSVLHCQVSRSLSGLQIWCSIYFPFENHSKI